MDKVKQNIIQQQQLDKFNIEKSVIGTEAYYINQDIQKGMSQDEIIEKARKNIGKELKFNKETVYQMSHGKKYKIIDENFMGFKVKNDSDKEVWISKDNFWREDSKESTEKKESSENQKKFISDVVSGKFKAKDFGIGDRFIYEFSDPKINNGKIQKVEGKVIDSFDDEGIMVQLATPIEYFDSDNHNKNKNNYNYQEYSSKKRVKSFELYDGEKDEWGSISNITKKI